MTKEQIASTAMNEVNFRNETKVEKIAFHKARINGFRHINGIKTREIAINEQKISDIHKEIMVLEEELWWERFINYCNTFC